MYYQPFQQPGFAENMSPNWQFQGYQNQGMSAVPPASPALQQVAGTQTEQLPVEQSYIENILRLNRGKHATVYMSFDGEIEAFTGIIEAAGRDHVILSDPQTGRRYVLLMVYLNFVTFDEEIEYDYPLGQMATYSPR